MTIFHTIKYSNDEWYDILEEFPTEVKGLFWEGYFGESTDCDINEYMQKFLLEYEGPL